MNYEFAIQELVICRKTNSKLKATSCELPINLYNDVWIFQIIKSYDCDNSFNKEYAQIV